MTTRKITTPRLAALLAGWLLSWLTTPAGACQVCHPRVQATIHAPDYNQNLLLILLPVGLLVATHEVVTSARVLYYRFHGVPQLYKSPYDEEYLRQVVTQIEAASQVQEAYLYFNNDIDASAIGNARQMQELVGSR